TYRSGAREKEGGRSRSEPASQHSVARLVGGKTESQRSVSRGRDPAAKVRRGREGFEKGRAGLFAKMADGVGPHPSGRRRNDAFPTRAGAALRADQGSTGL